jgi:hypothetical protein
MFERTCWSAQRVHLCFSHSCRRVHPSRSACSLRNPMLGGRLAGDGAWSVKTALSGPSFLRLNGSRLESQAYWQG